MKHTLLIDGNKTVTKQHSLGDKITYKDKKYMITNIVTRGQYVTYKGTKI